MSILSGNGLPNDYDNAYPVSLNFIQLSNMYLQRVRWHWHQELEIIYVTEGSIELQTDENKIHLGKGQCVLINQGVMHSIIPGDNTGENDFYYLLFHPQLIFGIGTNSLCDKYLTPVINSDSFRYLVLDAKNPSLSTLYQIANHILQINLQKEFGYELIAKSQFTMLWLLLAQHVIPQSKEAENHSIFSMDELRVKDVISYIEIHFAEPLTLDILANSVHISKSECCRCFKRTLDISPIEYLVKYRILQAANLIQSNSDAAETISELAFYVGFNNVSYFNKVFRKYLECTPGEYRKKAKKEPCKNFQSLYFC